MNEPRLAKADASIRRWFRAALAAVDPATAVELCLARDGTTLIIGDQRVRVAGRLVTIAVGKAAVGMARGAETVCGDLIGEGLVITKDGHATDAERVRLPVREAAHPIPDARGEAATREALALVSTLTANDVVLALISGGGSALLEATRPPLRLADVAATTDLLLRAGAPIDDLNLVRTALSLVKGGGLRGAAPDATFVTLILSDVLGNDPQVIASGPTIAGGGSIEAARDVLQRYGVERRVPANVVKALQDEQAGGDSASSVTNDVVAVVGDNEAAVRAAERAAVDEGMLVDLVWRQERGEAAELGQRWIGECQAARPKVDLLLGGGEATVTVRGDGVGGRNTEFALAAAMALHERGISDWVVASLATDGQDGPTGVAGAIADGGTVERARRAGVDAEAALANNDSLLLFTAAGGVVRPGPTGTNVNDLYFGLRVNGSRF